MDLTGLGQFISNVGFPVFVAIFMLIYMDKKLNTLTEVITELKTVIEICFSSRGGTGE